MRVLRKNVSLALEINRTNHSESGFGSHKSVKMPPKRSKAKLSVKSPRPPTESQLTAADREAQLRIELSTKIESLQQLQSRVVQLKDDNDTLSRQLDLTRHDSLECKRYLASKLDSHQQAMQLIRQTGEQKLEAIRFKRQEVLDYYEEKMKELMNEQHAKQDELEAIKLELNELKGVQELRKEQLEKIERLETQGGEMRRAHIEE